MTSSRSTMVWSGGMEMSTVIRSAVCLAAASLVSVSTPADAAMSPAVTLDGPGTDVLEVGGVALAEDGTGGVVYRRRSEGRSRIYVSRFLRGRWEGPMRVDAGQRFDSLWPRIAAARGGRLLVIWTQELGIGTDRLYSATLAPGAASFQAPVPVDIKVGEANATWPDVAMNRSGAALVTYRVMTDGSPANAPAGWTSTDIRLARWRGTTWSRRGAINRATSAPLPPADPGNGPKVSVDASGNGVVVWQEPDDVQVPRVWARRVFGGTSVGAPLPVSPLVVDKKPVASAADRFSVATAGLGAATVAFRQQADPASGFAAPTMMVNNLLDATSAKAGDFSGARGLVTAAAPGPTTSVSVNADGIYRVGLGDGAKVLGVRGDLLRGTDATQTLDPGSEAVGDPRTTIGPDGQTVWAWPTSTAGASGVTLFEEPFGEEAQRGFVTAQAGGPVRELRLGGSGLGDALIAFRQGTPVTSQLAAAFVDAAPGEFGVATPVEWVRPEQALIGWDTSPDALGGVTYAVILDGVVRAQGLTGRRLRLSPDGLDSGRYDVRVRAVDREGQTRLSSGVELKIDAQAPGVRIAARGRTVTVRVSDRDRAGSSGVETARVRFGDGAQSGAAQARHAYRRPGRYRVVVHARDRAGNTVQVQRQVTVR